MRNLGRFVLVGAGATVVDVGVFVLLAVGLRWWPVAADLAGLVLSGLFGVSVHSRFTVADDPERAFLRRRRGLVLTSLRAGAADLIVVALFTVGLDPRATWALLFAKLVALSVAFVFRVLGYRTSMFALVRAGQERPANRPSAPGDVRVSVVVPAYREADRIGESVRHIRAALERFDRDGGLEVLVVDDGSDDDTAAVAAAAGADRVIRLDVNGGKGGAVRAGMLAAAGRSVAFTDADLSYAPEQIIPLVERLEEGWDVVVGSRRHTETVALVRAGRLREIGGRVVNLLTAIVLLGGYRDTQCGLKAFRSDVARVLFSRSQVDGFGFDVELFHLAERYGLSLCEVPVEVVNTSRSTVRIVRDTRRLVTDLFRIRARARLGAYPPLDDELPPASTGPGGHRV